jgi:hypothetical protein
MSATPMRRWHASVELRALVARLEAHPDLADDPIV